MLRDYAEIILMLAVVCAAMVLGPHLDARADKQHYAHADATQAKRDTAARHACPPGETVVWVSASAHECLREIQ